MGHDYESLYSYEYARHDAAKCVLHQVSELLTCGYTAMSFLKAIVRLEKMLKMYREGRSAAAINNVYREGE